MSEAQGIYLVGFMGCGKTRLGRRLAAALDWEFADTDAEVERRSGIPVGEWFATRGEAAFRQAELAVLDRVEPSARRVIATGGGLFCSAEARRRIRGRGVSVWLDVPLEWIRERVGDGSSRPLWAGRDLLETRQLYEIRRAAYALADYRHRPADCDEEPTPEAIIGQIDHPGRCFRRGNSANSARP